jgi:hypothetical protein
MTIKKSVKQYRPAGITPFFPQMANGTSVTVGGAIQLLNPAPASTFTISTVVAAPSPIFNRMN